VNDEQNQRLQDWVAQAITPRRTLVDLFGGSGNLSARLAPQMTITHCVDSFAPQVAPPGTPEKMKFHRMSVLSWLLRNKIPLTPASAILDPPREGLGKEVAEIIASIERLGIDEVVAVGCDPDSWARDLKRFVDRGWIFVRGATIDLFPHTPHIESVGLLRRSVR
jgi:tRNA/tmRNA/rRNA uracil-C5-methylase (TrmA/RlmC/RlmD family)